MTPAHPTPTRQQPDRGKGLAVAVVSLVIVLAMGIVLLRQRTSRDPGQSTAASPSPALPGATDMATSAALADVVPVGTRMMFFDAPPETPISDPDELAEFRAQLRRRMLCTPDEAIWYAKMLTGTTSWVRQIVKRTSLVAATQWAKGEPAGDPANDNSPVVWLVLFENSTQLTRRSRFDLRQIVPPKDATEETEPMGDTYMALVFEETGQSESPLLLEIRNKKTIDEVFAFAQAIPELGSQYLERYPINTAGLCDEDPGDRSTPGSSPVGPTPDPAP